MESFLFLWFVKFGELWYESLDSLAKVWVTKTPLKLFVELFGGISCWFLMKDGIEENYGRKVNEKW